LTLKPPRPLQPELSIWNVPVMVEAPLPATTVHECVELQNPSPCVGDDPVARKVGVRRTELVTSAALPESAMRSQFVPAVPPPFATRLPRSQAYVDPDENVNVPPDEIVSVPG